jgi:hypothetical protein
MLDTLLKMMVSVLLIKKEKVFFLLLGHFKRHSFVSLRSAKSEKSSLLLQTKPGHSEQSEEPCIKKARNKKGKAAS